MGIEAELVRKLKHILEIARYAPSVHNTQPWRVHQDGELLRITIDHRYKLQSGDPTGRETTISLGIFVEAICGAAYDNDMSIKKVTFNGGAAVVRFGQYKHGDQARKFSTLLKARCTDRSLFKRVNLSEDILESIRRVPYADKTNIYVVTNRKTIETTAVLTSKAIRVALSSPSFRSELADYLKLPWSSARRGISVLSLGLPALLGVFEPILMRLGWGLNLESNAERRRWQSASAVVFVTAQGDMPNFWFNTGRTYLRVCLEIERLGLSQATSAAIVEASNYHDDIETLIGTRDRILATIRIGEGTRPRHHSARVNPVELLH
ncbi:MAG: hypothetical protein ACREGD_03480 [Candidatus Saccharimonadales bacterium]